MGVPKQSVRCSNLRWRTLRWKIANCSRRARYSSATCSKPPRIKRIIRKRETVAFNMRPEVCLASLLKISPLQNKPDFGEAHAYEAAESGLLSLQPAHHRAASH